MTTSLLAKTTAGRRLRPLQKHRRAAIASAASTTIAAWKAAVKREADAPAKAVGNGEAEGGENGAAREGGVAAAAAAKPASSRPSATAALSARAPSSSPAPAPPLASPSALPPPPTGDALRDRCRSMFEQALARAPEEWAALREEALRAADSGEGEGSSSIQLPPPPDATTPAIAAAEVEQATFEHCGASTGPSYKAKVRQLSFNLKDARNPDLRRRVLSGELEPSALPTLSAEDMASDAAKEEIARIREKKLFDSSPSSAKKATTDAFQCAKCRQRKTTYYQMQTRSADEPMTTFVTCLVCNNRWKFC